MAKDRLPAAADAAPDTDSDTGVAINVTKTPGAPVLDDSRLAQDSDSEQDSKSGVGSGVIGRKSAAKTIDIDISDDDPGADGTHTAATDEVATAVKPAAASNPWYRRKAFIIPVSVVLLVAAGAAALVLTGPSDAPADQASTVPPAAAKQQRMGAEIAIADSLVEVSSDMVAWQKAEVGDSVKQGQYVRSASTGRSVINLDDGSAIRLNGGSTIKLVKLLADDVEIANVAGEVYSRVVKSDRSFSVTVNDERYEALGTAYKTINSETVKGLEVYHSKVKADQAGKEVAEGSRYFQQNPQAELSKTVSTIPLDQLQKDPFLKWNLDQDKQSSDFKDKLGYLKTLESSPAPVAKPTPAPAAPTAAVTLSGSSASTGVALTWKLSGVAATKGFKIVRSLSANPTFGKDDAVYVSGSSVRSYVWGIKDGKTYHFRICLYNGEDCTNYSNDITVKAPLVAAVQPTGTLTLTAGTGRNVSWVLNGNAPHGYKLVSSKDSQTPTYPGSTAVYFEPGSTSGEIGSSTTGTHYVRICMYVDGACINYSNMVTVTVD